MVGWGKVMENNKIKIDFVLETFEKGDGEKSRRIGGYASTESLDRAGETLVQKGLNFDDFLQHGWFNDNHDKTTTGVVGYPETAEFHEGKGWYVEGYLLKGYKKADDIWDLSKALQKSDRKLGFSVEGSVIKKRNNKILKANIKHVAITHSPTNPDCTLAILSKSMCSNIDAEECKHCSSECEKAVEAGYGTSPDTQVSGGALRKESMEKQVKCTGCAEEVCKCNKKLGKKEIVKALLLRGYPEALVPKLALTILNPNTRAKLLEV